MKRPSSLKDAPQAKRHCMRPEQVNPAENCSENFPAAMERPRNLSPDRNRQKPPEPPVHYRFEGLPSKLRSFALQVSEIRQNFEERQNRVPISLFVLFVQKNFF